jgi:large subunit ribosomal protein L29
MTKEADQLRDVEIDELEAKLTEAKEELFNLRFQLVTGQLDNPMRLKQVRKQVARILTLIREHELEELENAGVATVEEA